MKIRLVVLVVLATVTIVLPQRFAMAQVPTKTTIDYTQDGRRFMLVYNRADRTLILAMPEDSLNGVEERKLLKAEVVRLTYNTNAQLGTNGLTMQFRGIYPTWQPFSTSYSMTTQPRLLACLRFAKNARIEGNVIYAEGEDRQPDYKPYPVRPSAVKGVRIPK